ncbi:MAG: alpha-glucosidase C-terminal domain-containing protein, partial [Clostridia bacterium]
ALQNRGGIEFVFAEKGAYPLAYVRSYGDEQVFVIINPSSKDAAFSCDYPIAESLYSFGENAVQRGVEITVPGRSAGFYRIGKK